MNPLNKPARGIRGEQPTFLADQAAFVAANKSTPPSMDPPPEVTPARELVDLDDFTCPAWNKLSWLTRALRTATCAVRGHDFESITWEEDDGGLDGIEHCKRCRKLF